MIVLKYLALSDWISLQQIETVKLLVLAFHLFLQLSSTFSFFIFGLKGTSSIKWL